VFLIVVGATIMMLRGGGLTFRTVVELREDQREKEPSLVAITSGGQPTRAKIVLSYADHEEKFDAASSEVSNFAKLRSTQVQLPCTQAQELKIWTHRLTPEGDSTSLPTLATLQCDSEQRAISLTDGQVVLPLANTACQIEIKLTEANSI
jgi:hypothetical protein